MIQNQPFGPKKKKIILAGWINWFAFGTDEVNYKIGWRVFHWRSLEVIGGDWRSYEVTPMIFLNGSSWHSSGTSPTPVLNLINSFDFLKKVSHIAKQMLSVSLQPSQCHQTFNLWEVLDDLGPLQISSFNLVKFSTHLTTPCFFALHLYHRHYRPHLFHSQSLFISSSKGLALLGKALSIPGI